MSRLTPAQAIVALVGAAFHVLVDLEDDKPPKTRLRSSKRKRRPSQRPNVRDPELPFDPREMVANMFRDKPADKDVEELFSGVADGLVRRPSPPPPNSRKEIPLEEAMNTYRPSRDSDEAGDEDSQPWMQV